MTSNPYGMHRFQDQVASQVEQWEANGIITEAPRTTRWNSPLYVIPRTVSILSSQSIVGKRQWRQGQRKQRQQQLKEDSRVGDPWRAPSGSGCWLGNG